MLVGCRFEQAEFVERELERMGEQIKETIQNINTAQVRNSSFVSRRSLLVWVSSVAPSLYYLKV